MSLSPLRSAVFAFTPLRVCLERVYMVCRIDNVLIAVQSGLATIICSSKQLELVIFKDPQTVAELAANALPS